jgi:hypothetical protein
MRGYDRLMPHTGALGGGRDNLGIWHEPMLRQIVNRLSSEGDEMGGMFETMDCQ